MNENSIPSKLLWVDLEMTGLDPCKQRIIEVAVIVTDFKLNELGRYEAIIHQDEAVLSGAEDWPKQHMQELFAKVAQSDKSEEAAVSELQKLVDEHFDGEPAVLAGNSIHQDRRFIRQWWPDFDARLHYRMFDVSSFKVWVQGSKGEQFEKNETHRAMDDILESIEELKWSLRKLT